jgi:L-fuculose-phosphate aldolase
MAYREQRPQKRRVPEHQVRDEMVRVGRLIWEKGFVAATDGNLSARLASDRLLVTPSGVSKGFLTASDLVVIRSDGAPVFRSAYYGDDSQPSSEILMHLEVYRQRPDVNAVIHAHPPLATAFSIAGVSLARCVLPEVVITMGGIPTAEYATPGTAEVPDSIRQAILDYDALILAHHGSLTVGDSLWEAYLRLEKVEHTAQITWAAQLLGRVQTLTPEAVVKLTEMRREWLQRQGRDLCQGCSVCLLGDEYLPFSVPDDRSAQAMTRDQDGVASRVAQDVIRRLGGQGST